MMYSSLIKILLISIMTRSPVYCNTKISLQYSPNDGTITCNINDSSFRDFMIHLYCPLHNTGHCFSNCKPACKQNSNGTCVPFLGSNSYQCSYNVHSSNEVSISYKIDVLQIRTSGDWSCQFKGIKSNSLFLRKHELPSSSTAKPNETLKTVSVPIKHVTIATEEPLNQGLPKDGTSRNYPTVQQDQSTKSAIIKNSINFLDYMTRPELVLVLILLLGISLLLNLCFLIRCVLLKSVIENYYRGVPNSQCILGCLCLDLVPHKYVHRRYSRVIGAAGSQQIVASGDFYKCQQMCPDNMAIYDDLSAVSNSSARVKMRSSNSSEMDEETRLTNIVPNGGGCHLNQMTTMGSVSSSLTRRYPSQGHAAYFHPGLGNYVIVSGPVATHDQYPVGNAGGPPSYALQMVSPIPSAPGSIGGGPGGTHHSASSAHSDESDTDSRTALSTSMPYRAHRVNSQPPIDLRDIMGPMNGLDHPLHYHHDNHMNLVRPNGSVPLHPWPKDNVANMMPTTAISVSSLPYYPPVSENGGCNQEMRGVHDKAVPSPPTDATLVDVVDQCSLVH